MEHLAPKNSKKLAQGFGEQGDFTLVTNNFQALNYTRFQLEVSIEWLF
jgi:hypothetical protein